jgi:hypothetical protein
MLDAVAGINPGHGTGFWYGDKLTLRAGQAFMEIKSSRLRLGRTA